MYRSHSGAPQKERIDTIVDLGPDDFIGELTALLTRYCAKSVSGTPNHILAHFLRGVLREFNDAVHQRAESRDEPVGIYEEDTR
jgi:hypothetical protein